MTMEQGRKVEGMSMPIASGGGETKASSSSSSGSSSYSPLSSLEALLADSLGSELFEEYLESEDLLQQLQFLFAVDGLKIPVSSNEPPLEKKIRSISQLVDRLVGLSETTKLQLLEDLANLPPCENVFDKARDEIEAHMKINLLPNFLKSDIYIHNYIKLQTIIEEGSTAVGITAPAAGAESTESTEPSTTSSTSIRPSSKEKEAASSSYSSRGATSRTVTSSGVVTLTSGALKATRHVRLDPTALPRLVVHNLRKGCGSSSVPVLNPYHASYSSYNPVSRNDSEIQSLSSAEGRVATGPGFLRKIEERKGTGLSNSGKIRKELPKDNLPKIHPTDAAVLMRKEIPKFDQEEFTRQLIKKLEIVAEERRRKETEAKSSRKAVEELRPHAIASALRKIQCGGQVEAADDILDQHLSRIWSDKTPIRSPPRHGSGQKVKKSNGSSRKKTLDTYSVDSGIEFKTPGYEINPLKKIPTRQKPGTSTTQEDSGISLVSSSFTQAQHRVAEWQANLPKPSSAHHSLHHQQLPLVSSSGPAPKKPTTPPRFTIFIFYSDGPEAKNNEPYRLSSDVTLTLGQLKQQLPRRGNYRYFFKKECSELNMVVQEEITRDDEYLPLFYVGKIVVTLQPQPQPL